MATTFTGNVKVSVQGSLTSSIDIGTLIHDINYSKTHALTNGDALNKANMIFVDTRSIALSSSEDLDLAGGLTNAFGVAITFTKIKGIIISAAATNTNNVLVGGGTAGLINWISDLSDVVVVKPGGTFALFAPDADGYAVTATTADILKIANSGAGTAVAYDIILIGTVA